jgi:chromosome segregation ATPase
MELNEFDDVLEAKQTLESAQKRLSELRSERSKLPEQVDELTEELTDAQATATVEGRDPSEDPDVKDLKAELEELRERHTQIETEIRTAEKVENKAESRLREAKEEAIRSVQSDATEEVGQALRRVRTALQDVTEEIEGLFSTFRKYDSVDAPISEVDSTERLPEAHPFNLQDLAVLARIDWQAVRGAVEDQIERVE